MVVAYRLGAITAFLLRTLGLVKIKHFSQPNLLAGKELVPEFFQEAASPEKPCQCARVLARATRRRGPRAAGVRCDTREASMRWR
jgi:lipid-A-disaccharide synthase